MAERLSKQVSDALLERIGKGEFRPGDVMPSEQALMSEYAVGRNTVREAMQALRALGLVEIRPRLGARVLDHGGESALSSPAMSVLLRDGTIRELYEVRSLLEPAAAAKAAAQRSEEDLLAIKRALRHFQVAAEMGEPVWQADMDFHHAIAVASGNSILPRILAPMSDLLIDSRRATGTIPAAVQRALEEHNAIAAAIEEQAVRRARSAMAGHIQSALWALDQLEASEGV